MTISQRSFDYCENIRTRVNNWAQGEGYGPGGFYRDTAENDVVFLLDHIADLEEESGVLAVEALEADAWRGRYNALLEEVEASRPREVEGNGSDLPTRTVVLDADGAAWQRTNYGIWDSIGGANELRESLNSTWGPYTIIYTPKEDS